MSEYLFCMKRLELQRDEKQRVKVGCAGGDISVYSHCAYCRHCAGVWVGKRAVPTPQSQALNDMRSGKASDDTLMNAAMMFNTMIRDGSAIDCSDDNNQGFTTRY
jgi:hypothetical protein